MNQNVWHTPMFLYALLSLSIFLALGSLAHQGFRLEGERRALQSELTSTKQEFASTSARLLFNIDTLNQLLATTTSERDDLEENLRDKQRIVEQMRLEVEAVSGTVGLYQKLYSIDRELLEKYSRVYFLNENYVPKLLVPIPPTYAYETEKEKLIEHRVWRFLEMMLSDANAEGIDLRVISAYRSFGTQGLLKSAYTVTYGSKTANKFSADQGYSEHQLGSTVDLTTVTLGTKFTALEGTNAYQWLTENAYNYGFILSYPKTNTFYIFEPWHWRFVGKGLARDLHEQERHFYDLTQRELDTYLISLFDE